MKKFFVVACILVGSPWLAGAALLLSDSFAYTNGPLVTVSGSPWTTYSGTTPGQASVIGERIFLSKNNSEDVHAPLWGAPYNSDAKTILYASFTLNVSTLPTSGGGYFAEFKAGGALDQHGRIFIGTAGATPSGTYRVGVANGSSPASAILTNNLSTNANYTVVLRYVISNATSTVWINPSAETNLSATATDVVGASSVSYFGFREDGASGSIGTFFVDNLLVGTAFSDVVTNAPQPPPPPNTTGTLSLVTYNLHGNGVANWSTNTAQVQAIGRQLMFLNPDIITFNEIPFTNTYQMTNWIKAFLPGYFLAVNSATDGYIRNGIASRYPILYSQTHLYSDDLAPFGYTASDFTRDLFEAEINVPNYSRPLHVFVVHLKATTGTSSVQYQDSADKRAAEASAVSNYFVNTFLPGTNGTHPYILSGDMNEDIFRPDTIKYTTGQPIQRMTSAPTGLRHTIPVNPITECEVTESIQGTLDVRFDYIMPCGLLYSNIVTSQVFRTDLLNLVPPNLLANDDITASDHLPVIMYFNNPYAVPFRLTSFAVTNQNATLKWESVTGLTYRVEISTNLAAWNVLASNLTATGTNYTFNTNLTGSVNFLRVRTP